MNWEGWGKSVHRVPDCGLPLPVQEFGHVFQALFLLRNGALPSCFQRKKRSSAPAVISCTRSAWFGHSLWVKHFSCNYMIMLPLLRCAYLGVDFCLYLLPKKGGQIAKFFFWTIRGRLCRLGGTCYTPKFFEDFHIRRSLDVPWILSSARPAFFLWTMPFVSF